MKYTFTASALIEIKNVVFPSTITIDTDDGVLIIKEPTLFGGKETRLNLSKISINIETFILFSDVIIETSGGKTYRLKGFYRSDAEKILDIFSKEH